MMLTENDSNNMFRIYSPNLSYWASKTKCFRWAVSISKSKYITYFTEKLIKNRLFFLIFPPEKSTIQSKLIVKDVRT